MPRRLLPLVLTTVLIPCGPAMATVLTVGPGQAYQTLAAALSAAAAGDTINVQAGTYTDQTAVVTQPVTIVGIGGTPVFTATGPVSNGKGILIVDASATIDNIAFSNASSDDDNGAGIRYESGDLVVRDSQFIGNQDGILATPSVSGTGSVLVQNSLFSNNGVGSGPGAGFAHAIYATQLALLTVQDSVFQGTQVGHDIKSRAVRTVISGNTLDDGVTGTTSYAIDIANGGDATITGNTITQGPRTENWAMISYAAEGLVWQDNALLVEGNTLTNTLSGMSIGVYNHASSVTAQVTCNAFTGLEQPVAGLATENGNNIDGPLPACAQGGDLPEPASWSPLLLGCLGLWRLRRGARN